MNDCPIEKNEVNAITAARLRVDIVTIFPEMLDGVLNNSMLKIGRDKGLLDLRAVNLRDYTTDKHHQTDDTPFGGGAGMVMIPDPIFRCVEDLTAGETGARVVLTTPGGKPYTQRKAEEFAACGRLVILCGRYEGVDDRVREHLVTDEVSIGDYVLTGGEIAAMAIVDSVARLIPGVLGRGESFEEESFSEGLLEYPHFSKPAEYRGWRIPEILLGGNHEAIRRWRRKESMRLTLERRPDLLKRHNFTHEDRKLLVEIEAELGLRAL
jgi:tRNA (guanine37-N1)-methyltransferase